MNKYQKEKSREIRDIMRTDPWRKMSYKEAKRKWRNGIRVLRRIPVDHKIQRDTMQFDACEGCLQEVLDYILTKKADTAVKE
jgi:hypothetical protein